MDFLPEPLRPSSSNLVFPCRCDPNGFDNGPLETFPERRGFRLNYWDERRFANVLTLADGSRPSVEQSTKLAQEWLFFGLLQVIHAIYGASFDGNDFVETFDGAKILTIKRLPQSVKTWSELEAKQTDIVVRQHFREVTLHHIRALLFVSNNFSALNHGGLSAEGGLHLVHEEERVNLESNLEVLLSVLLEALDIVTKTIRFRERRYWSYGNMGGEPVCRSIRGLTDNSNWCPSELNFLNLTFDNCSFYFASRVKRKSGVARHSQCTVNKCSAFFLEASTYQTAHVSTCRGCDHFTIDPTELSSILENDEETRVPCVRIVVTERDEVQAVFTTSESYVAISHVWSDGLGHPSGVNSLPECQLRRLKHLVQETGLEQPIVWIDALCVPAKAGLGKRNALARMADVYRNARNVLVLDSDLLSIPSICSNEELLLRIALSKWMRRLWTLEEGVLGGSRLLFQFSDRSIPLPEPHRPLCNDIALNCRSLITQYLPLDSDILSLITALHFRSTSWSADEPLCIGYILGLDITPIIDIEDLYLRMAELYHLLARENYTFPPQIVFTDEPKLNISPFRWAPASLLHLKPYDVRYLEGKGADANLVAIQTERGLQLQGGYDSCLLSFDEGAAIQKCLMIRIGTLSFMMCPVPKNAKCRSHERFWQEPDKSSRLAMDPSQDWTESWRANYQFRPTGNWGLIYSKGGGYGVMVAVNGLRDQVLYTTLIGQVHLYELCTSHSSIISNLNQELWRAPGNTMLDENQVRREQDRTEHEAFNEEHCSKVNCVQRFAEDVTWCIG
ncbi:MAG: hypothetical protein Q9160_009301 [Pyrenula sp. 1 TL-2023]